MQFDKDTVKSYIRKIQDRLPSLPGKMNACRHVWNSILRLLSRIPAYLRITADRAKKLLLSARFRKIYRSRTVQVTALTVFALLVLAAAAAAGGSGTSGNGSGRTGSDTGTPGPAYTARTLSGVTVPSLAEAGSGLLDRTETRAQTLYEQSHRELIEEYRDLLDKGQGSTFLPGSEAEREVWQQVRAQRKEELQQEPLLLLVNKWHYLPDGYEAQPVELPNGQQIGSVCYEQLMQMLEECREAGGTPIVCSGYRPHWYQVNLFDAQINRWLYAGYGQEDAEALAATAVAVPGTSEHELGLAADIYSTENMDLDESQVYTFTQQWLMENCWRFGFVLRYPKDKTDITGIIFEPWHYRYVGYEHARKIYDAGICLEEYLDETDHPES